MATTYAVKKGDTFYGLAKKYHGNKSQKAYQDELIKINSGKLPKNGTIKLPWSTAPKPKGVKGKISKKKASKVKKNTKNIKKTRKPKHESKNTGTCECSQASIKNGFIKGMGYIKKVQSRLAHKGKFRIKAIVLHRTNSTNVLSAMSGTVEGTHFYVDNSGNVYQTVSLKKKTWHVGKGLYSKAKDKTGTGKYPNSWPHKKRGKVEAKKSYPNRYPMNSDSVGIEVSGEFHITSGKVQSGKYKGESKGYWDALTAKQKKAIVCLCKVLKKKYKLTNGDIYAHDDIKAKTKGEGSSYIHSILKELK